PVPTGRRRGGRRACRPGGRSGSGRRRRSGHRPRTDCSSRGLTCGSPAEDNRRMLHRNAKIDLIKRAPLFARCTKKEIEQVAHLADEIDLREGKELTVEGQPGREVFVLIEGTAEVRRKGRKVNEMKKGDYFGE